MVFLGNLESKTLQDFLQEPFGDQKGIYIREGSRGEIKLQLIRLGHPVQDLAGFKEGHPLSFELRSQLQQSKKPFILRKYQQAAADVFHAGGGPEGGLASLSFPVERAKQLSGWPV